MRLSTAVAVALLTALFVGCNQPLGPTSPSFSGPSGVPIPSVPAAKLSADVVAGPSSGNEVPFKGTLEGRLTISTPLEPPLLSNLNEASGTATHLGRFTLEIPHIVNTMTRIGTGTYEFTAANGDTLVATFTGQATVVAPGVLSVLDTATITGGTGRFAGATGSFTTERVFVMATGDITGSFEGKISSPGASRR
jgi:hypothetical protein